MKWKQKGLTWQQTCRDMVQSLSYTNAENEESIMQEGDTSKTHLNPTNKQN